MNIVLVEDPSTEQIFPSQDRVYLHVCQTLRMKRGDIFDIGLRNGPRGKAEICELDAGYLKVIIAWGDVPSKLRPVRMILGLSRPQTVQKQLNVLATLGVSKMLFVPTDRGEPSYAKSRVWRDELWKRHVLDGVEQAFDTHVPEVQVSESLEAAVDSPAFRARGIVLDNYESPQSLSRILESHNASEPMCLAIGSERGWTARERNLFRQYKFAFAHLGTRVLRCETAATIAASVALGIA